MITFLLSACSGKEKEQATIQEHNAAVESAQSDLVRTGEIDIDAIDKNGDGKVYECPMDWNVISDEAGDCPVCGMKLREYSFVGVKSNLDKYGYKYKK